MTHEYESQFAPRVEYWFVQEYGEENVEANYYIDLPGYSRWYADLRVDVGYAVLYLEVENDGASVRDGIGQSQAYATESPIEGVPLVVVPKDHLPEDKIDRLRDSTHAVIREFDAANMEFV